MANNFNKGDSKFIKIGYVSETKKSQSGDSEKTFMLNVNPLDKDLAAIQLPRGSRIMLRAPKRGKSMSDADYEKLLSWCLFDAILIQDNEGSED